LPRVDRFKKNQWQGKYHRKRWLNALNKRVPKGSEIGMEAFASSHYWGRELQKMGNKVKLLAAQFVKP
jgi:transposase